MEWIMGIKGVKQVFIFCLAVLVLTGAGMGCSSGDKTVEQPDAFEKWRVLAETSKGATPAPRDYNIEQAMPAQSTPVKQDRHQALSDDKKAPESELPVMPITMKMHDVDVSVLLRTLARIAGMNIMINETVTGKARINISKLPWDKAFKGVLSTYGLTYHFENQVLRVITVEDLNKEIELMEARQKFEKQKKQHAITMLAIEKEEEKLDPLITRIVKLDYADIEPLRDNLEKYLIATKKDLESIKGTGEQGEQNQENTSLRGAILMDKTTNSLIIQATAGEIEKIMPIIRELDRPSHQILIEAHIVEANSDTAKELGVQWGGLGLHQEGDNNNTWIGGGMGGFDGSLIGGSDDADIVQLPSIGSISNFPSSEDAGTAGWEGLTLGIMNHELGGWLLYTQLTALQKEGKLNILSKPSITTMDHRKATIESGSEVPFQTVEDDEVKIEYKKAVIKLEVTPHVVNNKVIRLDILTHKDELDWTQTVAGNPTIITKNAETKVNLYDGQTTVIGGLNKELVQESEAGIPYLKDIPGLGVLFKNNSDSADMEELLIFITPHILKQKAEHSNAGQTVPEKIR